jgi:hypothetical protein
MDFTGSALVADDAESIPFSDFTLVGSELAAGGFRSEGTVKPNLLLKKYDLYDITCEFGKTCN